VTAVVFVRGVGCVGIVAALHFVVGVHFVPGVLRVVLLMPGMCFF